MSVTITIPCALLTWDDNGLSIRSREYNFDNKCEANWYLCKSGIAHFGYSERHIPLIYDDEGNIEDGDYDECKVTIAMTDGTTYVLLYRETCGYIFTDIRKNLRRV